MEIIQGIYEITVAERIKNPGDEILDINRNIMEPYIYQYLMETYGPMLRAHWTTYKPPKKSNNVFMIAERRAHPNFRFILQNIAWAGPDMAVYIFCSEENLEFIKTILSDKIDYYNIFPVFNGNPTREQGKIAYNNLLTDYRFYELVDAKYMLTAQMDNIFRKKIDPAIFSGDYWGAPWSWKSDAAGGGGATVRRIQAMIDVCQTHRPEPDIPFDVTEDSWLSEHVTVYPDGDFRTNHIMESIHVDDPHIIHQFWTFSHCYLVLPKDEFVNVWAKLLHIS